MNLTDDKEQNQNVEAKYLDPELGFDIKIKRDKLYKIKKISSKAKNAKIVKPVYDPDINNPDIVSNFDKLDHYGKNPGLILDNFENESFLTDDFLDEILIDTQSDNYE